MNYKQSGVNIQKGANFILDNITNIKSTYNDCIYKSKNDFSGLYDISTINKSILSVSCDGVGSKVKLAIKYNNLTGLGQDLVAMSVNDIICSGATPLLFLDYYATYKLKRKQSDTILNGIINACKYSNIVLLGGETSEMPSVYNNNEFDLAGFCVGMSNKQDIIDPNNVKPYQTIIGIKSSGPHSNGYSLINKIVTKHTPKHIIKKLLEPTLIYTKEIAKLKAMTTLYGIAHITGGGIVDNLVRILPNNISVFLNMSNYEIPNIFKWIKYSGNISKKEMEKVFNLGIGMIVIINSKDKFDVLEMLGNDGIDLGYTLNSTDKTGTIIFS